MSIRTTVNVFQSLLAVMRGVQSYLSCFGRRVFPFSSVLHTREIYVHESIFSGSETSLCGPNLIREGERVFAN